MTDRLDSAHHMLLCLPSPLSPSLLFPLSFFPLSSSFPSSLSLPHSLPLSSLSSPFYSSFISPYFLSFSFFFSPPPLSPLFFSFLSSYLLLLALFFLLPTSLFVFIYLLPSFCLCKTKSHFLAQLDPKLKAILLPRPSILVDCKPVCRHQLCTLLSKPMKWLRFALCFSFFQGENWTMERCGNFFQGCRALEERAPILWTLSPLTFSQDQVPKSTSFRLSGCHNDGFP